MAGVLILLGLNAHSCAGAGLPPVVDLPSVASTGGAGGVPSHVRVTQTSVVGDLRPGLPGQELRGTITNPHPWPVFVRSVSASVTRTSNPACAPTSFTVNGSPARVADLVAPGPHRGSWSGMTIALESTDTNQDACKDVTLEIAYRIP